MKVILLRDIKHVGHKYDVKDVSDGYAFNFLIPQKFAEIGTVSALKKVEALKTADLALRKVNEDLLLKNLASLEGVTVEIKQKASDKGHLFKGVHREELVADIKKQTNLDILPEHIMLDKPLKEVGEHVVEVKVQDKKVKFKVAISALS